MSFGHTKYGLWFDPPLADGSPPPWCPSEQWIESGRLVEVFPQLSGTNCKCSHGLHDRKCAWGLGGWVKLVDGEFAGWWALAEVPTGRHETPVDYFEVKPATALELLAQEAEPSDE